ncbi:MAG TPA: GspE/PulE family protein [bacterium]
MSQEPQASSQSEAAAGRVTRRRSARAKANGHTGPERPDAARPRSETRLLEDLIAHALDAHATDVHVTAGSRGCRVRERIDGLLADVPLAAEALSAVPGVMARLKLLAGLDAGPRRVPQEGRAACVLSGRRIELRVSVIPSPRGDSVAVRIQDPSEDLSLDRLGMTDAQLRPFQSLIDAAAGLVLVTGPGGSGRTTTLYAALEHLNSGQRHVLAVEETHGRELDNVTQIPLASEAGLTYAAAIRAALRHDPDVIMIEDIADPETASAAIRAALTGHLVLGGMHTKDASSAVTRLMDFGVEPYLLCSTLAGMVSQRLLRRVCPACREHQQLDASALSRAGLPAGKGGAEPAGVWRALGCPACRQTGYAGRTGVFELLAVDSAVRGLLAKRASGLQIRQSAMARGMTSLAENAWQHVRDGLTSLDEYLRAIPPELR